ncbi:ABC transporter ATP-binding protein [Candidatus Gracilibacteria bacterium]|nr:ABC transporter ATP-binding protein [Candidatus Gracilibacteria bacterium]
MRIFTTLNTTCFTLFLAYFLKEIVHEIEMGDMAGFRETLIWSSIIMVTFQVLGFIFRNYYWVEQQYIWEPFIYRKNLEKFIKLEQEKIEALGTGRILSILQKGIEESTQSLLGIMSHLTRIVCALIFGFFLARSLPWQIIVIGIIVIILIFSAIVYLNKYTTFYRKQRKENNVRTTGALAKIIMSKFEVLQNNSINKEIEKLNTISDYSRDLARKQNFWGSFLFQTPKFLLSGIIVGCYYYLGMRVFGASYSLSDMIGIMTVLAMFEVTLRDSIEYYESFTKAFVHIEKLWEFMDHTTEIEGYNTGTKFQFKKGDYELQNVGFSYHSQSSVLENFSVKISGGKKTALVGRSGGGKTTIMKLIAGYMRPTSGVLMIDNQDITEIRLDSYYPHIGYLTQEPSVFDGTIEENLLYGARGKITKEKMQKAIELAECQFIYELEEGIKTEIGERGVRLSGGQKQRLAIAKIFLKDPEIILLDEPTAALDSYSEQKVAKAFEHLFEGRTVIVIAHRLQTVKSADDIIVLEKGKVVERGTHRELLKLGKKYAGMVDLQSGVVREDETEQ